MSMVPTAGLKGDMNNPKVTLRILKGDIKNFIKKLRTTFGRPVHILITSLAISFCFISFSLFSKFSPTYIFFLEFRDICR